MRSDSLDREDNCRNVRIELCHVESDIRIIVKFKHKGWLWKLAKWLEKRDC